MADMKSDTNSGNWIYWVIFAVFSVPLAGAGESLMFQYDLPLSPGAYVWGLLRHVANCGFLTCVGSLFGTMLVIDSVCWFILLWVGWFTVSTLRTNKHSGK